MYQVLSPVGQSILEVVPPTGRPLDLGGKTVCEITNGAYKSLMTFPIIRELLQKRYPDLRVVPYTEFPLQLGTGNTADLLQQTATATALMVENGCDAVITGNGG
ncbi:hypothetical protein ACFLWC_06880 [Chloroflexota bacterium]